MAPRIRSRTAGAQVTCSSHSPSAVCRRMTAPKLSLCWSLCIIHIYIYEISSTPKRDYLTCLGAQSRFRDKLLRILSGVSPKRDCAPKGVEQGCTRYPEGRVRLRAIYQVLYHKIGFPFLGGFWLPLAFVLLLPAGGGHSYFCILYFLWVWPETQRYTFWPLVWPHT